jgi:hypothetical protein
VDNKLRDKQQDNSDMIRVSIQLGPWPLRTGIVIACCLLPNTATMVSRLATRLIAIGRLTFPLLYQIEPISGFARTSVSNCGPPPFVFRSLLFAFASSWMIVGVVPRCYFMGGVECRCSSMSVTTSVLTFRRLLWKTRPSPGEVTRCKADVYIIRILRSHFSHNLSTSNFPTKRHQLQFSIANLNLVATHQNAYFPHLYSS